MQGIQGIHYAHLSGSVCLLERQFGWLVLGAVFLFVVIIGDTLACLDVGRGELYEAVAVLACEAHTGRTEFA